MLNDFISVLAGLLAIVAGGSFVTDGSVAVAQRLRLSPLLIGLTVVAFGSSTPDLAVTLISVIGGHAQLGVGDIVGANIFDLTLVAGIVALISPVLFNPQARNFDLPMLLLSGFVLLICADDRVIDGPQFANTLDRSDGMILLVLFTYFMYILLRDALRDKQNGHTAAPDPTFRFNALKTVIMIAGGITALVVGGNWLVDGASGIARRVGMSEGLIGLTVVGIGNALPDLATSAVAAAKKQPGIAMGNLIGACIFNVFFVLGVCAIIRPIESGSVGIVDFGTLVLSSLLLVIFGTLSRSHSINRWQGALLIAIYLAYMAYLIGRMC